MSVAAGDLKEMIRSTLKQELDQREGIKALANNQQSHIDHLCECPDCMCGAVEKLRKLSDYQCRDCKFPWGNEEYAKKLKACPNCGGERGEKIEKGSSGSGWW